MKPLYSIGGPQLNWGIMETRGLKRLLILFLTIVGFGLMGREGRKGVSRVFFFPWSFAGLPCYLFVVDSVGMSMLAQLLEEDEEEEKRKDVVCSLFC